LGDYPRQVLHYVEVLSYRFDQKYLERAYKLLQLLDKAEYIQTIVNKHAEYKILSDVASGEYEKVIASDLDSDNAFLNKQVKQAKKALGQWEDTLENHPEVLRAIFPVSIEELSFELEIYRCNGIKLQMTAIDYVRKFEFLDKKIMAINRPSTLSLVNEEHNLFQIAHTAFETNNMCYFNALKISNHERFLITRESKYAETVEDKLSLVNGKESIFEAGGLDLKNEETLFKYANYLKKCDISSSFNCFLDVLKQSNSRSQRTKASTVEVINQLYESSSLVVPTELFSFFEGYTYELLALIDRQTVRDIFKSYKLPYELFLILEPDNSHHAEVLAHYPLNHKDYRTFKRLLFENLFRLVDETWYMKLLELERLLRDRENAVKEPNVNKVDKIDSYVSLVLERLFMGYIGEGSQFGRNFRSSFYKKLISLKDPGKRYVAMKGVIKQLGEIINKPRKVSIDETCPQLHMLFNDSTIILKGYERQFTITGVQDSVLCLATKTRPKKITFKLDDGTYHSFLFKGAEDLHLDGQLIKFYKVIKSLLSKNCNIDLMPLYAVIPSCNLIEWVEDAVPCYSLYKAWQNKNKVSERPHETYRQILSEEKGEDRRIRAFEKMTAKSPSNLISLEIMACSNDYRAWFQKQLNFTRSSSITSLINYFLGIGDRHLDNILVNFVTGCVIHVDFNINLERGTLLQIPEVVPIRLTRNFIGNAPLFYQTMVNSFKELKQHEEFLCSYLQLWKHDGCIDWGYDANRRVIPEKTKFKLYDEKGISDADLAQPFLRYKDLKIENDDNDEERNSLEANNVNVHGKFKHLRFIVDKSFSDKNYLLKRVVEKLQGDGSIESQVKRIIQVSTSPENLSKMYAGWMPWI
jgi:hypothetical protein